MLNVLSIATGFVMDLFLGDPGGFTHPVVLIGKLISYLENLFVKFINKKIAGILLLLFVVFITYLITYFVSKISFIIEILLIYMIFASRSLAIEAKKIFVDLSNKNVPGARKKLSFLVSRDVNNLDEEGIVRATVETVSENLVDGITSPMFYLFLGGAPLAMAYKAVSTLDSMVGYKNKEYKDLGWASAKFDDLLNFLPARITAFIIVPIAALISGMGLKKILPIVFRDRLNHASPNSAHSEAAFAAAMGIQLGGPTEYFGKLHDKPYIGDKIQDLNKNHITESIRLMYFSSVCSLLIGIIIYVIGHFKG